MLTEKRNNLCGQNPAGAPVCLVAALFFFSMLFATNGYCQKSDTFSVHFDLNDPRLNKRAGDFIDNLIFKDVLIHGQKLILLGFADYLGSNGHNDSLSNARAKNVEDYLVNAGFDKKDITLCIGKGKINRTPVGKDGFGRDRKVQIIIDRGSPPPLKSSVLDISKAKVNQTITLKNILFVGGQPIILESSLPELNNLLKLLIDNKTLRIQIEGHICCVGSVEGVDDNNLSVFRAKAIYDFLVSKGIDPHRLTYVGLGNRNPVSREENTEEDREKNRRVEIRILDK